MLIYCYKVKIEIFSRNFYIKSKLFGKQYVREGNTRQKHFGIQNFSFEQF